jgi:hypothetical protein
LIARHGAAASPAEDALAYAFALKAVGKVS